MTNQAKGVIPHLVVEGAAAALEFYKKALAASEVMRVPADDGKRLLHAEIQVNGARIYVRDDFPEYRTESCSSGHVLPPKVMEGTSVTPHLDVENCDAAVERAVAAGATLVMPPEDAFWGARYGQVVDPFGHAWSFSHPLPGQPG